MATKVEPWAVLERALRVYRSQAAVLLPLSLLVATLAAVAHRPQPGPALVAFPLELVAAALFAGTAIQLTHATARAGVDGSPRACVRAGARALLPTVALGLAEGVVAGIGAIALVSVFVTTLLGTSTADIAANAAVGVLMLLVGVALAIRWAVVVPVAVIERRGVGASFHRSWRLVRGQSWRVMASVALVYVPPTALTWLANAVRDGSHRPLAMLPFVAVATVAWPLAALMHPVLYHALLATSPAAGEPPAPAPGPPRWLMRGTRWRVALWSFLALAWFLLLAQFAAVTRTGHASGAGLLAWLVGMVVLVRCAWVTARRLRAARRAAKAGTTQRLPLP